MNHKNTSSAWHVAAMALTAVAFAIPQQALAYRHHNNHNSKSIKIDQQISQANVCTGASSADTGPDDSSANQPLDEEAPPAPTVCLNTANNTANIHG